MMRRAPIPLILAPILVILSVLAFIPVARVAAPELRAADPTSVPPIPTGPSNHTSPANPTRTPLLMDPPTPIASPTPFHPASPCLRTPPIANDRLTTFLLNFQQARAQALLTASTTCLRAVAEGAELANLIGAVNVLATIGERIRVHMYSFTVDAVYRESLDTIAVRATLDEARTPLSATGAPSGPAVRDRRQVLYRLRIAPHAPTGGGWMVEDEAIDHTAGPGAALQGPHAAALQSVANQSTVQQLAATATGADLLRVVAQDGFAVHPQARVPDFFTEVGGQADGPSSGLYARNTVDSVPSIVTVDSALHVYHLLQARTLLTAEMTVLPGRLRALLEGLLQATGAQIVRLPPGAARDATRRNAIYLAVADRLLGGQVPRGVLDPAGTALVNEEVSRIAAHAGTAPSPYLKRPLSYASFTPQDHYRLSATLTGYAEARYWLQAAAPALELRGGMDPQAATQESLQVLLLVLAFREGSTGESLLQRWHDLADPLIALEGQPNGPTLPDFAALVTQVYGTGPAGKGIDDARLARLDALSSTLPIAHQAGPLAAPTAARMLDLVPQPDHPDEDLLAQAGRGPNAAPTSGLELLAALGSQQAWALQAHVGSRPAYGPATPASSDLAAELGGSSLYDAGLNLLRRLIEPAAPQSPDYTRSPAWARLQQIRALGWWADLHQDPQMLSGALDRYPDRSDPSLVPVHRQAYVEPVPQTWQALADLAARLLEVTRTDSLLEGLPPADERTLLAAEYDFAAGLPHFTHLASDELLGRAPQPQDLPYTEDPDLFLGRIQVVALHHSTSPVAVQGSQLASIAVVAQTGNALPNLQAGEGPPQELWALVPIDGQLYLARGVIYSYYEIAGTRPRLSESRWQSGGWAAQRQPSWAVPFAR